jgi:hypothetical protein
MGKDQEAIGWAPQNAERIERFVAAMNMTPNPRKRELDLFTARPIKGTKLALDLGSGTGFLADALAGRGWSVDTIDRVFAAPASSRQHLQIDLRNGIPDQGQVGCYSLITSLASLHHLAPTTERICETLAKDLSRLAARGCELVIEDVPSRERTLRLPYISEHREGALTTIEFFEEVVDQLSIVEHGGVYVDLESVGQQLQEYCWQVVESRPRDCAWMFRSRGSAHEFIINLFGIARAHTAEAVYFIDRRLCEVSGGFLFEWVLDSLVMRFE